jgi:DNA-binding GntR family transcriptional regulator
MNKKLETLRAETLKQQIAQSLAKDIRFRRILPGTRLREVMLANRFKVGRPLIREVLHILEQEGLVEIVPWRGAHVAVLTEAQLFDLYDVASIMFGLMARKVAERATNAQLAEIREKVNRLEDLTRQEASLEEYITARDSVHQAIDYAEGPEPGLNSVRPNIRRIFHQFEFDGVRTQEQRLESMHRWRTLLKFFEDRDASGAQHQASMMVLSQRPAALEALREVQDT